MNEETDNPAKVSDESLAAAMPDPAGPPRPVEANDPALHALGIVGVALVTVGGLLLPLSVSTTATMGATQSAKIKWEERQSEIQKALADECVSIPNQSDEPEQGRRDRDGK